MTNFLRGIQEKLKKENFQNAESITYNVESR